MNLPKQLIEFRKKQKAEFKKKSGGKKYVDLREKLTKAKNHSEEKQK